MTPRGPIASLRFALGFALTIAISSAAFAQAPAGQPATAPRSAESLAAPAVNGAVATYERKGRRDPFQPVENLQAEMTSPTVASARLKGIVLGQTPRALVETPDGLGYILKVGDVLAEGRLIEIGANSVVFSVPTRRGSTNRIVLRLPDD